MRRIPRFIFVFAAFAAATRAAPGPSAPPRDPVLAQVIDVAKARALNAPAVDWPAVEQAADALTAAKPGEDGRTAAIRHVLRALADGHSHYVPPRPPQTGVSGTATASSPAKAAARERPPIATAATDAQFGRLVINAWTGDNDAVTVAAGTVRHALAQALAVDDCGLIIDVASNGGGNMWPMMGGIAPLYDEGALETFESRAGGRQAVNVRDGLLRMGDTVYPSADGLVPLHAKPRYIAVLLGKQTASSGEITALGFKGQRNVRFFGRPTAGATTANSSIFLSNGGKLALTTARILDRTGVVHTGPVLPDVATDDAMGEATAWLASSCR